MSWWLCPSLLLYAYLVKHAVKSTSQNSFQNHLGKDSWQWVLMLTHPAIVHCNSPVQAWQMQKLIVLQKSNISCCWPKAYLTTESQLGVILTVIKVKKKNAMFSWLPLTLLLSMSVVLKKAARFTSAPLLLPPKLAGAQQGYQQIPRCWCHPAGQTLVMYHGHTIKFSLWSI